MGHLSHFKLVMQLNWFLLWNQSAERWWVRDPRAINKVLGSK